MIETVVKLDRVQSPILKMDISINRSMCAHLINSLKAEPLKFINSNFSIITIYELCLKCLKLNKYASVHGGYI